jgi:hypothetical protein
LDQFVETELLWPGHFNGAIFNGAPTAILRAALATSSAAMGWMSTGASLPVVPSVMLLTNSKNCVAHERSDTGDYSGVISSQTRCVEREFAR